MPTPRKRIQALARGLLLAAAAAIPTGYALAAPPDPVFNVLLTDGSTFRARLVGLEPGGGFVLDPPDGERRSLPPGAVVKLSRDDLTLTYRPEGSVLVFPEGDRLYRTSIGSATETAVEVQAFALPGSLEVPLESLLGLVFTLPQDPDAAEAQLRRVREAPRTTEVLWLANDDRLDVGFLGLTEKTVQYQAGDRPASIDRSRVAALAFDPTLVAYPAPPEGHLDLTLADGSRLGVAGPRLEQGHIAGTARFGAPIRVPLPEVVRIHARTPSVVYLAERTPAAERLVPYVGPVRPSRRDATVEGRPFRLRGEEFDRGIGTESRTLLAYRLEPGDRRFQATVGLDDRAGPQGSVVFKVRVDNREAFATAPMAAGDIPVSIDVDLSGASVLILQTEFGERGGVRDIADWVEARIIR